MDKENKNFFGEQDKVVLQEYEPDYPSRYNAEKRRLQAMLPQQLVSIHHVGSTAITGIKSKPVIDIAVAVFPFPLREKALELIQAGGYVYWEANPDPAHQFFFRNMPRTHHLHVYPSDSQALQDKLSFRDYLMIHPQVAKQYEALKVQLAAKYSNDRERYTQAKAQFVAQVLKKTTSTR